MFWLVWFGRGIKIAVFMHDERIVRNCHVTLKSFTPGFHIYFFIQLLSAKMSNEVKTWNFFSG